MSQEHLFFTNSLITMVHNKNLLADNECILDNNDNIYVYKTFTWDELLHHEPIHGLSLMLIANKEVVTNVTDDSECSYCGSSDDIYNICNFTLCEMCMDEGFAKDGDTLDNWDCKILRSKCNDIIEIGRGCNPNIYYIKNNSISWYQSVIWPSCCYECCNIFPREQLFIIRYGTNVSFNCNNCVNIQHIEYQHVKCKTLTVSNLNDRIKLVVCYHLFLIQHIPDLTTDTKFYLSNVYTILF